jgi:YfiH family protein
MEYEKNKIEWIEYDLLSQFTKLVNATFLRHGGTSIGAFVSLNFSNSVGDNPDSVKVNRELMKKNINIPSVVFANQIHGTNIVEITQENKNEIHQADVIYTREKDIGLCITHADCQAALFFDAKQEIICAVHAGWRGLVNNIYKKTVDHFVNSLKTDLKDLYVCISPSLGSNHANFSNYKEEFPKEIWSYQTKSDYFDLKAIANDQLKDIGINEKQIEISDICTFENSKDCYSYRREKITGRNVTVIAMQK